MKRFLSLTLCVVMLVGCSPQKTPSQKQYTATFLSLFDTVTTVLGKADSEEAFEAMVKPLREGLEHYHRLFDIYNEYEGINNLKTINDKAAISPVSADNAILDLLEVCKDYYEITNGVFNPAMGSVLRLWHAAREDGINDPTNAALPDHGALTEAARHINPNHILLDRKQGTVFFSDPDLKLDVGAIAKGWATARVCETLPEGLLVSVGGNVVATGPKDASGTPWAVGLQNPEMTNNYLHILNITHGCVVTSGNYQRTYTVDGKSYHHIIDPATLYPGTLWTAVSVVCEDSGVGDMLSTALFLLDMERGQALLDRFHAHAMWVDTEGNRYYSPEFRTLIKN